VSLLRLREVEVGARPTEMRLQVAHLRLEPRRKVDRDEETHCTVVFVVVG